MKKFFAILLVGMLALSCLAGCAGGGNKNGYDYDAIPDTVESADGKYEIAFVTDVGQLKDKSFNQGTWEGVKRYAKENNKTYKYYQPDNGQNATDDDRYNAMAAAAKNGAKIIVCAGFMQGTALAKAAEEFTEVKFVFIDGWSLSMDNVAGIIFREEQSGYLAGYAAVMEGYTKLGFAGGGGGTNPACCRFGYGFVQGAAAAAEAKGVDVAIKYSWNYGDTFAASAELQTMLNGWYSTGTEVVFACGGSMCQSAFAAASANQGKVIGVDVDQSAESSTVITSATKGLREAVMLACAAAYGTNWASEYGGDNCKNLGAEVDAVGLPTDTWSLKNFSIDEYNTLFAKLKNGSVTIEGSPAAENYAGGTMGRVTVEIVK